MPFRLMPPPTAADRVIPLGDDATLTLRAPTALDWEVARGRVDRALGQAAAANVYLASVGLGAVGEEVAEDPVMREWLVLIEVIMETASGWVGVMDETGAPAPLDRAHVALLLTDAGRYRPVALAIATSGHVHPLEKKTSMKAPAGTSAAAQTIAEPAAT